MGVIVLDEVHLLRGRHSLKLDTALLILGAYLVRCLLQRRVGQRVGTSRPVLDVPNHRERVVQFVDRPLERLQRGAGCLGSACRGTCLLAHQRRGPLRRVVHGGRGEQLAEHPAFDPLGGFSRTSPRSTDDPQSHVERAIWPRLGHLNDRVVRYLGHVERRFEHRLGETRMPRLARDEPFGEPRPWGYRVKPAGRLRRHERLPFRPEIERWVVALHHLAEVSRVGHRQRGARRGRRHVP